MNETEYMVTLNVPPVLEEAMVDCLLSFEGEDGFSSFPIFFHDHKNRDLSLVEQVSGKKRMICFQIYLPENQLPSFKQTLRNEFGTSGINYNVMPIFEQGKI